MPGKHHPTMGGKHDPTIDTLLALGPFNFALTALWLMLQQSSKVLFQQS